MGDVEDADTPQDSDDEAGGADDIEKQIAKEVAAMKRPRKETRFGRFGGIFHECRISSAFLANCLTNTPCGMFLL